jgi:hypothetical protein
MEIRDAHIELMPYLSVHSRVLGHSPCPPKPNDE